MSREPHRVLVLDGNPGAQAEIEQILANDGLAIDYCSRIVDAVRSLKEALYVAAVVDVGLTDTPWDQAVGILKAVDGKLPIILTAERNTRELEIKVREQDVFYYYIKSFDAEELRLAVLEALRLSRGP
jgi:DNA-binding response OmpR family regulator